MKLDNKIYEEKMKKTITVLNEEFESIRVGRASPRVLDRIQVSYYGTMSDIESVATVKTVDARTLLITPWEAKTLKDIEKAIQASDLGINPQNDGKVIRLIFPALNEERRLELKKQVKKYGEDAKVSVRGIRRDAIEDFKKQKKNSEITEDDMKQAESDIQKFTDKYIEKIDAVVEKKEKEIMEI